jgi:hypothetical protein
MSIILSEQACEDQIRADLEGALPGPVRRYEAPGRRGMW